MRDLTSRQKEIYQAFIDCDYDYTATFKKLGIDRKSVISTLFYCHVKCGCPLIKQPNSRVTSFMVNKAGERAIEWHRTVEDIQPLDLAKEFKEAILKHKPYEYKPIYKYNLSGNAIEIAIHDLHFGSLCWGEETGDNYDIKIAQTIFLDAINHLVKATKLFKPDCYVLPVGSDFFNVNSMLNTTTAGTLQDEDCRWQKTYIYGRKMMVLAIDILRKHAPVNVVIIAGNHDTERAYYLGDSLDCWYQKCNNVDVNNSPQPRKYWRWGKCLLGLTHGSEEVKGTLPMLMAVEEPKLWAKTKYREWHIGHLHHKATKSYDFGVENQGVRERIIGSLAATDSWHKKKGYSGLREAHFLHILLAH